MREREAKARKRKRKHSGKTPAIPNLKKSATKG
jgi:hypothetical protein